MRKAFLIIISILLTTYQGHAVLKESDLSHTLSLLREELTTYYKDLLSESKSHKEYREQMFKDLIEILFIKEIYYGQH